MSRWLFCAEVNLALPIDLTNKDRRSLPPKY